MKIKAKWGFIGNALLLGAQSSKVTAGQTFDNVDEEYGHTLVGKGLAEQASDEAKPRTSRQTAPRTARPAGPEVTKPTATAEATLPTDPASGADAGGDLVAAALAPETANATADGNE